MIGAAIAVRSAGGRLLMVARNWPRDGGPRWAITGDPHLCRDGVLTCGHCGSGSKFGKGLWWASVHSTLRALHQSRRASGFVARVHPCCRRCRRYPVVKKPSVLIRKQGQKFERHAHVLRCARGRWYLGTIMSLRLVRGTLDRRSGSLAIVGVYTTMVTVVLVLVCQGDHAMVTPCRKEV